MSDKQNITISIANQAPIPLSINRNDEEIFRQAEYSVNRLWLSWCNRYKTKSPSEVLAMVAFRFAELFYRTEANAQEAQDSMAAFEARLNEILLDMGEPEK